MEVTTIQKLNLLTQKFYEKVADNFSRTRQTPWHGWSMALASIKPFISAQNISVLDVGCGNGRFLTFLHKSPASNITYHGVDGNKFLLQQAKDELLETKADGDVVNLDIVEEVLADTFVKKFTGQQFDLLSCFGVFHHVPSQDLRKKFIADLAQLTAPNGIVIISFWQFGEFKRFQDKKLNPEDFGIQPDELEAGDFFLGWDSDTKIARYCHSFTQDEVQELLRTSGLHLLETFEADGREGRVNTYLVLQRPEQ